MVMTIYVLGKSFSSSIKDPWKEKQNQKWAPLLKIYLHVDCGFSQLWDIPYLYFTVSTTCHQPRTIYGQVNTDLLVRVHLPIQAEQWSPRNLEKYRN